MNKTQPIHDGTPHAKYDSYILESKHSAFSELKITKMVNDKLEILAVIIGLNVLGTIHSTHVYKVHDDNITADLRSAVLKGYRELETHLRNQEKRL